MEQLIAQLIGGAVGGGAGGRAVQGSNMGNIGNLIAGAAGGVAGGQLLGLGSLLGDGGGIASMASSLVGGGVAGLVVQVVVGIIVKKMKGRLPEGAPQRRRARLYQLSKALVPRNTRQVSRTSKTRDIVITALAVSNHCP